MDNSIKIHFRDLADVSPEDGQQYIHIHGYLAIEINGEIVDDLGEEGYYNNVCFNDWVENLVDLIEVVETRSSNRLLIDDGEDDVPGFLFEIEDDGRVICFSIVDSEVGDGIAHPDWEEARFSYEAFKLAFENFREHFMEWIRQRAPESYTHWMVIFNM